MIEDKAAAALLLAAPRFKANVADGYYIAECVIKVKDGVGGIEGTTMRLKNADTPFAENPAVIFKWDEL